MKNILLIMAMVTLLENSATAQTEQDRKEITRAMLDYVEGFYEGDTSKIIRGISSQVVKYGYWKDEKTGMYAGEGMSFREMIDYASGVKAKNRQRPATTIKKTDILEMQENIANGKVTAWWGIDYLLLEKINNKWMIRMVMWQGPIGTIK